MTKEIESLQKQINELQEKLNRIEEEKETVWPTVGDDYCYVTPHGGISWCEFDNCAQEYFYSSVHPFFKTRQSAEKYIEIRKKLWKIATAGGIPSFDDWHNGDIFKHALVIHLVMNQIEDSIVRWSFPGSIFHYSLKDYKEQALSEIGHENLVWYAEAHMRGWA